jgi:dTDP-L-rhamnose 4-epimerase
MRSERVLVTGGAGFIGSHLVTVLAQRGQAVRVLDNLSPQIHGDGSSYIPPHPSVEFQRGSIDSRADLAAALDGVGVVVHLAAETGTAQSMYEIARYNMVNSQGTALLFDLLANAATRTVRRVVLASSRSIYGEGAYLRSDGSRITPDSRSPAQLAAHAWEPQDAATGETLKPVATKESDPPRPASIYAATKWAQEDIFRIAGEALGIEFATLRFQNVYGEGQSLKNPYTGILSIFSNRIRLGQEIALFEDGEESRDFVHVDDIVSALVASIDVERAPNAAINVGSGTATSVREIATLLHESLGKTPILRVTAEYRIGDIRHNWADVTLLRQMLGCEPQVALAQGVQRFCDWVLTQPIAEDQLARANEELRARRLMGR